MSLRAHRRQARNVCAGPGKAFDQARSDRIAGDDDDRDVTGGLLCRHGAGRVESDNHIDLKPDQLGRELRQPAELAFSRSELDHIIAFFNAAQLAQPFAKLLLESRHVGIADDERAYPVHLRALRPRDCRPYGRRAHQPSNQLPPPHEHLPRERTCSGPSEAPFLLSG